MMCSWACCSLHSEEIVGQSNMYSGLITYADWRPILVRSLPLQSWGYRYAWPQGDVSQRVARQQKMRNLASMRLSGNLWHLGDLSQRQNTFRQACLSVSLLRWSHSDTAHVKTYVRFHRMLQPFCNDMPDAHCMTVGLIRVIKVAICPLWTRYVEKLENGRQLNSAFWLWSCIMIISKNAEVSAAFNWLCHADAQHTGVITFLKISTYAGVFFSKACPLAMQKEERSSLTSGAICRFSPSYDCM